MIDFRSDTFTKPSSDMLQTMFQAEVGDDVFGEDPTVNKLESIASAIFGMESAIFCPSGTMTNQIAIKCHTQPGDEVICDKLSHIYIYEGGGIAFNSGCSVKPLEGNFGQITPKMVKAAVNPDDIHKPVSRLVSLENTANRGGGSCYDFEEIKAIKDICLTNNLSLHLDGARLFNALVEKNESPIQYGETFDSISICLSKGLGTPVGSILLGNKEFIKKARRFRKVFGGGMRQAGILAAAGVFALENNISRLAVDHHHARLIEDALRNKDFVIDIFPVQTNIIILEVGGRLTAPQFVQILLQHNIKVIAISDYQVRFVLHLDITESMVEKTISILEKL